MTMTHYMELLAVNQPWNLLIFMAIPVILAETVAISELYLLATRRNDGPVRRLNQGAGIAAGLYFSVIVIHLLQTAVIPLTGSGGWRGAADIVAVGFYLAGVVPLLGLALLDLGLLGRGWASQRKVAVHAGMVGLFLIVAHIAMIFGMLDPTVAGWTPDGQSPPHQSRHHPIGN